MIPRATVDGAPQQFHSRKAGRACQGNFGALHQSALRAAARWGKIQLNEVLELQARGKQSVPLRPTIGVAQHRPGTPMATPRIIKKYPNRRLYDTETSTYITLAEVKDLVMQYKEFQVQDAKSGEDLTRSILLQIILEEESGGVPM